MCPKMVRPFEMDDQWTDMVVLDVDVDKYVDKL